MEWGIEFTIIALIALLGGVIAVRMKQPPVLGLLLAGAIAGPHALGIVENEQILRFSIDIGAFLLLFLIGMEFSIAHLFQSGSRVLLIAAVKLGIVFFFGQGISLLLGFDALTSLFIGVILSITSTVIFLKILEQKGLQKQKEVSLLVGVLILEDIFGIFALTFFSSLDSAADITPFTILGKLVYSLAILGVVYLFLAKRINKIVEWLTRYSTDETFVFISIGIASGLGAITHLLGLSEAVGAFLAGNIVASLKNADRFEKPMHPFIFVFTSLFFFSIGGIVDIRVIMDEWLIILILFAVSILVKFLAVGFSLYLLSESSGRGAVFGGLSMISLGEFSLLLAAEASDLVPNLDLVSITAAIIFLSTVTMAALVTKSDAIYRILLRISPKSIRVDMDATALYLRDVSAKLKKNKERRKQFQLEWRKILNNIIGIVFIGALLWLWHRATGFRYIESATDWIRLYSSPWVVGALLAIVLLFPTFGIIRNLRHFFLDFSTSLVETYPKEIANSKKLSRNIFFIVVLFVLSVTLPPVFSLLGLSTAWAALSIPLLIVLIVLFLNSESLVKEIEEHHHAPHGKFKGVHHHKNKKE